MYCQFCRVASYHSDLRIHYSIIIAFSQQTLELMIIHISVSLYMSIRNGEYCWTCRKWKPRHDGSPIMQYKSTYCDCTCRKITQKINKAKYPAPFPIAAKVHYMNNNFLPSLVELSYQLYPSKRASVTLRGKLGVFYYYMFPIPIVT